MSINGFILKTKKAESPFYAGLKRLGEAVFHLQIPIPRFLDPFYRGYLWLHYLRYETGERLSVAFYRYPVARMLCASMGKRVRVEKIPDFTGNPRVYIGDDVYLSGTLIVSAGRIFPNPEFRVGNRTFIGHRSEFWVAKSIEIGEDVLIAGGCWITDYSHHPLDPEKRISGLQVSPEEVRPVRIGNRAWLGRNATILPGVTIGDDAVIGACAVVTKDVPPGAICVGNPGRILSRTVYDSKPGNLVSAD